MPFSFTDAIEALSSVPDGDAERWNEVLSDFSRSNASIFSLQAELAGDKAAFLGLVQRRLQEYCTIIEKPKSLNTSAVKLLLLSCDCIRICCRERDGLESILRESTFDDILRVAELHTHTQHAAELGSSHPQLQSHDSETREAREVALRCLTNALNEDTAATAAFLSMGGLQRVVDIIAEVCRIPTVSSSGSGAELAQFTTAPRDLAKIAFFATKLVYMLVSQGGRSEALRLIQPSSSLYILVAALRSCLLHTDIGDLPDEVGVEGDRDGSISTNVFRVSSSSCAAGGGGAKGDSTSASTKTTMSVATQSQGLGGDDNTDTGASKYLLEKHAASGKISTESNNTDVDVDCEGKHLSERCLSSVVLEEECMGEDNSCKEVIPFVRSTFVITESRKDLFVEACKLLYAVDVFSAPSSEHTNYAKQILSSTICDVISATYLPIGLIANDRALSGTALLACKEHALQLAMIASDCLADDWVRRKCVPALCDTLQALVSEGVSAQQQRDLRRQSMLLSPILAVLTTLAKKHADSKAQLKRYIFPNDWRDIQASSHRSQNTVTGSTGTILDTCCNKSSTTSAVHTHATQGNSISSNSAIDPTDAPAGTLRGSLVSLMTSLDTVLKRHAAEFIYELCDENEAEFVARTGFGNAVALLRIKGLI